MRYTLNSGYGQVIGQFPFTGSGKVFIVGDSGTANREMLQELFRVDPDGDVRFFSTIDAAIGECTANAGDVIYVMPGHTETISSATSLVVDVAGVSIIGLGTGNNRPVLLFTNTAGTVEMDAANTRLSNVILKASVSGVNVGINVDADGVEIDHCEFQYDETGDDFQIMIDVDGVDHAYIHDNRFIAEETAGCNEAIRIDDAHFTRVVRNFFTGDFTNAFIYTGSGDAASKGLEIADNSGYNSDTTAGANIDINVASTGIIKDNKFGTAYTGDPKDTFDPGSCASAGNTVAVIPDGFETPVPVAPFGQWNIAVKRSDVFDGGTADAHGDADGASNPYTLFSVTGDVEVLIVGIVNTNLAGATATLEVGVAGNTAKLLPQTTATDLADGDVWTDTGAEAGVDVFATETFVINDGADIIETTGTADITAGQIDYYCFWRPLEPGAKVVAA